VVVLLLEDGSDDGCVRFSYLFGGFKKKKKNWTSESPNWIGSVSFKETFLYSQN
jgi:hypothetical protein